MLTEEERDRLGEANPEALLADGFEEAYLGIFMRFGQEPLASYDYGKCIDVLMQRDGMSYEDAVEFFDFNVIGAWMGDGTPVFIDRGCSNDPGEGQTSRDDSEVHAVGS